MKTGSLHGPRCGSNSILAVFAVVILLGPLQGSGLWAQGGDPDGKTNIASESRLPQGWGLAKQYPRDSGLGADPAVILFEDFQADDYREKWREVRDPEQQVLSIATQPLLSLPKDNRTLQVTARLSQNTGGGLTTWFQPKEQVHFRFYVRFDEDCDYVHHFCTVRANKALQGRDAWSGFGGAGIRPQGDERFSTAIEPFGDWGRLPPPGRWNFYSYWYQMSPSPDGKFWGNAFRPAAQENIPRGKWICVEMMLKHNTPGEADGQQAYWIDGKLVGHWEGIPWRKSPDLWANSFTLESYVTDSWTKQEENTVWFDQLVIADRYIGPLYHDDNDK